MNGIVFKLFKRFIVQKFDYIGWTQIQDTFFHKEDSHLGSQSEFFVLLRMASDILREPQTELLQKFGKYCFLHLLEHSSLEKDEDDLADVFFYSDPLLNLKVKKLSDIDELGWEIDGELKVIKEEIKRDGKSAFCSFINGFLNEGDKYYNHTISLDHFQSTPDEYDSCKITVFVNNN